MTSYCVVTFLVSVSYTILKGSWFCREDLAKPATNLYLHNLNGILETAIRATNAQYDDADILKRLDVRLLEVSEVLVLLLYHLTTLLLRILLLCYWPQPVLLISPLIHAK